MKIILNKISEFRHDVLFSTYDLNIKWTNHKNLIGFYNDMDKMERLIKREILERIEINYIKKIY